VKPEQTFFIGTSTWQKRSLFQSTQLAELFCRVLLEYRDQGKFSLQAFVLMPDHFHLLITPAFDMTLERSLQLIKGGFSFRVKKELEKNLEIWQRGFTDRRVRGVEEFVRFRHYIHENPVKGRLCEKAEDYP
jgi:putative transposase